MEEYISGIKIEYKKNKNKCRRPYCEVVREKALTEIEELVEMINYLDNNTTEDLSYYDSEYEHNYYCDYCGNTLTFKYNPMDLYKKYH